MKCNNLDMYFSVNESIDNIFADIKVSISKYSIILNSSSVSHKDINKILTRALQLEENNKVFNGIDNEYTNYFIDYLYHPTIINNKISTLSTVSDNRILKINSAVYKTNLYNLLILHLANNISKIKHTKLRNEIKFLISNMKENAIYNIQTNNKCEPLLELLKKQNYEKIILYTIYNNMLSIIKKIIITNKNSNIKEIKRIILEIIDSKRFKFDNNYIYKILKLNKKELISKIKELLSKSITHTKLNINNDNTVLTLCDGVKKSYFCEKNKLIISKSEYDNLLDILYYDLTNPYKQSILLNYTKINNGLYSFDNNIHEKIYIYY